MREGATIPDNNKVLLTIFIVMYVFPILFPIWLNARVVASKNQPAECTIVLDQNFDIEPSGSIPKNWSLDQSHGSFTVNATVYHGEGGRSAKVIDNSTEGSPSPYRNFTAQTGAIVVMFAITLNNNTENLEVYVDNGDFAGANIIFNADGTIRYRNRNGKLVLLRDSYFQNRWYRIKMIMNIPDNFYNIHIDDHLEAVNAQFTDECDQIHRIVISSALPCWKPIGYIDDIKVRRCIEIPEDFPTIQEGIDAASLGDIVFVAKERIYFENVIIEKKNVWLIGEDMYTTVIDGRFVKTKGRESNGISVMQCCNVTIYGFTIKNAEADGVYIDGSNNAITNNIVNCSLGCGIHIVGSKNTVTNNTINSNLKCGVYISGSNSTVRNNIIESNDDCGVYISGSGNIVTNSTIESNLECGIHIVTGEDNLVKKNIIKNNGDGIKCDADTEDNTIYQNRFVCNDIQALDYGSNIWDDGYPYRPEEEKGGGNYWSNYSCVDMYSGVNQDEHGPSCSPLPDGVCDAPYITGCKSQDNYPLFLIQNVSQEPETDITYLTSVTVKATMLEDVQVEEARMYVCQNSECEEINMTISDNLLTGTIPAKPACTMVRYNVSARAYCAVWLNSTNYPLVSPYHVLDRIPAEMSLRYKNKMCDDPCNIDFGVISKYKMKTDSDLKICNIAPTGGKSLNWTMNVIKGNSWLTIKPQENIILPGKCKSINLTVNTKDLQPCLECVHVGEISVKANGTVPQWGIVIEVRVGHIIIDDSWASSEAPNRCNVDSTQNYTFHAIWAHNRSDATSGKIKVSPLRKWWPVNKTGWAIFPYKSPTPIKKTFKVEKVNFTYIYNGKVYYITSFDHEAPSLITIWDRVIIKLEITDKRIDVCSAADVFWTASKYKYDGSTFEGYPLFNDTLHHDTVGKWCITTSSIVDLKYNLTAFKSNTVCCIWDRIKIIGGGVSHPQIEVGQTETGWFIAIYEYDNEMFKGTMGKLFLNNESMNWSPKKDRWEKDYSFDTPGTRTFQITRVEDEVYNLTKIEDLVGPLQITWSPSPIILEEWVVWAVMTIIGSTVTLVILIWSIVKIRMRTRL